MNRKICPVCNSSRPAVSFVSSRPSGACQVCVDTLYTSAGRDICVSLTDSVREEVAKRRSNAMLRGLLARAKRQDCPVSVTAAWIFERMMAGRCEVTGLSLDLMGVDGPSGPFTPSIDRINGHLGYTEENSRIVVWIYNAAKGAFRDEHVRVMAAAICFGGESDAVRASNVYLPFQCVDASRETSKESRSAAAAAASRKAWRARKRRSRASINGGNPSAPYLQRVVKATTPEKSSAVIADELGVTPAYVRAAWRRAGLGRRPVGVRPEQSKDSK